VTKKGPRVKINNQKSTKMPWVSFSFLNISVIFVFASPHNGACGMSHVFSGIRVILACAAFLATHLHLPDL